MIMGHPDCYTLGHLIARRSIILAFQPTRFHHDRLTNVKLASYVCFFVKSLQTNPLFIHITSLFHEILDTAKLELFNTYNTFFGCHTTQEI